MKKLFIVAIIAVLTAGCATRGAGYVPLVDLKNRDVAQFNVDTTECQAYAKTQLSAAQAAMAGAVLGALLGAALAPRGYRNNVAGYGAVAGASGSAVSANDTQENITKRCLAGRGWSVLN